MRSIERSKFTCVPLIFAMRKRAAASVVAATKNVLGEEREVVTVAAGKLQGPEYLTATLLFYSLQLLTASSFLLLLFCFSSNRSSIYQIGGTSQCQMLCLVKLGKYSVISIFFPERDKRHHRPYTSLWVVIVGLRPVF